MFKFFGVYGVLGLIAVSCGSSFEADNQESTMKQQGLPPKHISGPDFPKEDAWVILDEFIAVYPKCWGEKIKKKRDGSANVGWVTNPGQNGSCYSWKTKAKCEDYNELRKHGNFNLNPYQGCKILK